MQQVYGGKLKTATQMVAIALLFIDANPFGAIFSGNLAGATFAFNLVTTVLMSISIIATNFFWNRLFKKWKRFI